MQICLNDTLLLCCVTQQLAKSGGIEKLQCILAMQLSHRNTIAAAVLASHNCAVSAQTCHALFSKYDCCFPLL